MRQGPGTPEQPANISVTRRRRAPSARARLVLENNGHPRKSEVAVLDYGRSISAHEVDLPGPRSVGRIEAREVDARREAHAAGVARLSIHDASGRRIADLVSGSASAGAHSVVWDGRDDRGARLPPGVYFARLETADVARTRKIHLVR